MADQSRAPEQFSFYDADLANKWKLWKQKFEFYLLASGKNDKKDNVKIAVLLNLLGDEALAIYNTFEYDEISGENKEKLITILDKFEKYCSPRKNLVFEHIF